MAVTMKEVRFWLDPEEPDYDGAAQALGPEAMPLLLQLIQGGDLALASKATYLASMIPVPGAAQALEAARARGEPLLRVAAASGLRHLATEAAEPLLEQLRQDPDAGVRKVALRSAVGLRSPRIDAILRAMASDDPAAHVRETARQILGPGER